VPRNCARFGKRVLIPSTSEVYGKGVAIPFREDDDVLTGATCKHRWAYSCAKALDEFLALAHWRETRLPVVIVRLFNTVGPRQLGQYGMVLPRFVQAALKGEPLLVYGDGEQTRSFAHVSDIVGALARVLELPHCLGKVINLGSDEEVSINRLARLILELTDSSSEIRHMPYGEAYGQGFEDMQRRVPCLDRGLAVAELPSTARSQGHHPGRSGRIRKCESSRRVMTRFAPSPDTRLREHLIPLLSAPRRRVRG